PVPAPTAAAPAGGDENGARLERELGLLVSPPMREVQSIVEQAARADVTVLICGETGVGKELIAHSIHAHSPRRRPPFVNVICATNRDLAREVAAGRFREDLFYRLNVINILIRPLRERREEIPGLVRYFVQRYARLFNFPEPEITADAMQAFVQYAWPGNIR